MVTGRGWELGRGEELGSRCRLATTRRSESKCQGLEHAFSSASRTPPGEAGVPRRGRGSPLRLEQQLLCDILCLWAAGGVVQGSPHLEGPGANIYPESHCSHSPSPPQHPRP